MATEQHDTTPRVGQIWQCDHEKRRVIHVYGNDVLFARGPAAWFDTLAEWHAWAATARLISDAPEQGEAQADELARQRELVHKLDAVIDATLDALGLARGLDSSAIIARAKALVALESKLTADLAAAEAREQYQIKRADQAERERDESRRRVTASCDAAHAAGAAEERERVVRILKAEIEAEQIKARSPSTAADARHTRFLYALEAQCILNLVNDTTATPAPAPPPAHDPAQVERWRVIVAGLSKQSPDGEIGVWRTCETWLPGIDIAAEQAAAKGGKA